MIGCPYPFREALVAQREEGHGLSAHLGIAPAADTSLSRGHALLWESYVQRLIQLGNKGTAIPTHCRAVPGHFHSSAPNEATEAGAGPAWQLSFPLCPALPFLSLL